jgi:hypothetical protein
VRVTLKIHGGYGTHVVQVLYRCVVAATTLDLLCEWW